MRTVSMEFAERDLRQAEEACRFLANWYLRAADREFAETVKHALIKEAREMEELAARLKHARQYESYERSRKGLVGKLTLVTRPPPASDATAPDNKSLSAS